MPQKQPDRQTAARVPDAEQPYPVPDNWAWVTLDQINQRISKTIDPTKTPDASFELYSVPSFDEQRPECLTGSDIKSSKQRVNEGDVLLCKINPHLNRVWIVGNFSSHQKIASSEWIVITPLEQVLNQYMRRYLQSNDFRNLLTSQVAGIGGSLVRAQPKNVRQYPVPVPPLAEQRRIVATLDSLLGKLRAARDLLDAARDSFALRRAAILHKAFSGQLTAAWRKEHPDLARPEFEEYQEQPYEIPESWAWMKVDKIVNSTNSGFACAKTHEISEFESDAYPHLRPNNIGFKEKLNLEKVVFIPKDKVEPTKSFLKKGSVLFNNTNSTELVGRAVYIEEDMNYAFSNHINLIEVNIEIVLPKWFTYAINKLWTDGFFRRYSKKWVGQSGYNQEMLKHATFIPIPPIEEQREIVRRLDALLTHEAEAAALLDMDEHLDLLEQSILARAFRGELGTRDPADAPAVIG